MHSTVPAKCQALGEVEASYDRQRGCFDEKQLANTMKRLSSAPLRRQTLSSGQLRTGEIVEYRGMVQDMFDPELFCIEFKHRHSQERCVSIFGDRVPESWEPASDSKLVEREVIYLVPVPGETCWMRNLHLPIDEPATWSDSHSVRNPEPGNAKRQSPYESEMEVVVEQGQVSTKRVRAEPSNNHTVLLPAESQPAVLLGENNPLGDTESETPCMIKLYDGLLSYPRRSRRLKLRDIVRVMGILSLEGPADFDENHPFNEARDCLPASVAPRVHVLDIVLEDQPLELFRQPSFSFENARHSCLHLISACLSGDALAAEFVLLWLVSSVALRDPMVGKMTLALSKVAPAQHLVGNALSRLLSALVPRFQVLAPPDLKTGLMFPKKDMELNRLRAGRMQCADGTRVIFDETQIGVGTLSEQEATNLQALNTVCASQQISYDFTFFSTDQDVDFPVLVLTPNSKPCLVGEVDVVVPLRPETTGGNPLADIETALLPGHQLEACRFYLETARTMTMGMDFDDAVARQAENDFVQSRHDLVQQATGGLGNKITEEDLHLWLNITRLLAASVGAPQATPVHYGRARTLDALRRRRM
jgi:hypothetical protein